MQLLFGVRTTQVDCSYVARVLVEVVEALG